MVSPEIGSGFNCSVGYCHTLSTFFSILGSGPGEGSLVGGLWRWKTWGSPSPLRPAEKSGHCVALVSGVCAWAESLYWVPVLLWRVWDSAGIVCSLSGSQDRLRDFLSFLSNPVSSEGPVGQGWGT